MGAKDLSFQGSRPVMSVIKEIPTDLFRKYFPIVVSVMAHQFRANYTDTSGVITCSSVKANLRPITIVLFFLCAHINSVEWSQTSS